MSETQPTVKLRAADQTDVGMVRDHNEDSGYVDPELGFFIVADGMGGHAAGEVASAMAVEQVRDALAGNRDKLAKFAAAPTDEERRDVVAVLENAVRAAHQAVFSRGVKETDKQGMGTTLDVLLVTGAEAFIAHVGDSRTYLLRDGKAAQITTDHTVAEVLVIEGKLSMEEAQASPLRTILVNAIGVSADVGVEISHVRLRKGDRLLLCSDGLHDYFPSDEEIAEHLLEGEPKSGLSEMVEIAKQRGGHDNITGIVVEVLECIPPPEADAPPNADGDADAEASVSDGVPREVGVAETMPVEANAEDGTKKPAAVPAPTPPSAEDVANRTTLPMGAEAIAGKAKGKAKPDDATIRKTEPMPTVAEATADPDADTVDADAEADGDGESNGGDDKAASS
jgi:serine/threonine protein phosphatase PrpC